MHLCSTCKNSLPAETFHLDRSKPAGVSSRCKLCVKEYRAAYYARNAEKAKADTRAYAKENALYWKTLGQVWREANRERHLANRSKSFARRYYSDPGFNASTKLRAMLQRTLKATGKPKDFVTFQKIGYTAEQLQQRLEMNFQPGMSWQNFGDWEIDHRVPVSRFVARGELRPEVINCLANLKPLWREQNRSKGNRYAS